MRASLRHRHLQLATLHLQLAVLRQRRLQLASLRLHSLLCFAIATCSNGPVLLFKKCPQHAMLRHVSLSAVGYSLLLRLVLLRHRRRRVLTRSDPNQWTSHLLHASLPALCRALAAGVPLASPPPIVVARLLRGYYEGYYEATTRLLRGYP